LYPVLPEYWAVIVCVPEASAAVLHEALAELSATLEQRVVAPSLKVTVPVATPALPETCAVKVTFSPGCDGLWLEAMVIVGSIGAGFTTWLRGEEIALAYVASPE
jgi:hypothetical protein